MVSIGQLVSYRTLFQAEVFNFDHWLIDSPAENSVCFSSGSKNRISLPTSSPFYMASEANREKTRERAAKDSHSRLLSRAALSWILATAPTGELAYRLKSNQQTWFQLIKREFPFANGLNNLFRTVITKKTLAQMIFTIFLSSSVLSATVALWLFVGTCFLKVNHVLKRFTHLLNKSRGIPTSFLRFLTHSRCMDCAFVSLVFAISASYYVGAWNRLV